MLPDRWTYTEEAYNFRSDPRTIGAHVVLSVDESSYTGRQAAGLCLVNTNSISTDTGVRNYSQGSPHPIGTIIGDTFGLLCNSPSPPSAAWYQEHGAGADDAASAGRSFYTSLGHLNSTWEDQNFLAHVLGGIQWALELNTTRAMNPDGQVGAQPSGNITSTSSGAASTSTG
ncbi:hypothetical protein FRC09_002547 [Ceratobasidium sp. 395]|nr:hypothetical protein FRC09_002547 [Ceratobasidium sp. 395]